MAIKISRLLTLYIIYSHDEEEEIPASCWNNITRVFFPMRNPTTNETREFGSTAHDVPAVALSVSNHIFFLFYLSIPLEEEEEKNSHPHHLEGIYTKKR